MIINPFSFGAAPPPVGDPYEWAIISHLAAPTAGAFTFSGLTLTAYERLEIYLSGITVTTDQSFVQVRFRVGATPTTATHRWAVSSESTSGTIDDNSGSADTEIDVVANAAAFPVGNVATDALFGVMSVIKPAAAHERYMSYRGQHGYGNASANVGTEQGVMKITDTDPITSIVVLGSSNLVAGMVTLAGLKKA